MNNADLITKVAKATNHNEYSSSHGTEFRSFQKGKSQAHQSVSGGLKSHVSATASDDHGHIVIIPDAENEAPIVLDGIQKTVTTAVVSRLYEEDGVVSESSSTRHLRNWATAGKDQ